ncbi:MAG: GNAT family N-acetyltransferase [Acidimicrobiales bacterium]
MEVPVLTTDRLRLRGFVNDDRDAFARMNADPRVMEHFPSPLSREESDALVDRINAAWLNGFGLWAVDVGDTGAFAGFIGLGLPRFEAHFTPAIEVGWRLCVDAWGRGLATEGARATLSWAREVGLQPPRGEVVSMTTVGNWRSRRVMEHLGFTHHDEDDFDHPTLPEWEFRRHVLYRRPLYDPNN